MWPFDKQDVRGQLWQQQLCKRIALDRMTSLTVSRRRWRLGDAIQSVIGPLSSTCTHLNRPHKHDHVFNDFANNSITLSCPTLSRLAVTLQYRSRSPSSCRYCIFTHFYCTTLGCGGWLDHKQHSVIGMLVISLLNVPGLTCWSANFPWWNTSSTNPLLGTLATESQRRQSGAQTSWICADVDIFWVENCSFLGSQRLTRHTETIWLYHDHPIQGRHVTSSLIRQKPVGSKKAQKK